MSDYYQSTGSFEDQERFYVILLSDIEKYNLFDNITLGDNTSLKSKFTVNSTPKEIQKLYAMFSGHYIGPKTDSQANLQSGVVDKIYEEPSLKEKLTMSDLNSFNNKIMEPLIKDKQLRTSIQQYYYDASEWFKSPDTDPNSLSYTYWENAYNDSKKVDLRVGDVLSNLP